MKTQNTLLFSISYFLIGLFVILVKLLEIPDYENYSKPLLVLLLMAWYVSDQFVNGKAIHWFFVFALFFSLLGDVFLMPLFDHFILGLLFFLVSHLLYIAVFTKGNRSIIFPTLKKGKLFLVQMLSFYLGLMLILMYKIVETDSVVLMIAIPIYATVLLFMVLSTYVFSKVYFYNYGRYVLLGGIFFFVSDSILAINKFVVNLDYSPLWVMGTYIMAQWFLVYGFLNSQNEQQAF
ncbi:MAG: lysoplasmalogenase [Bacteroidales bacterium]|nr:lysoplasmalogenase [Bacteroidales bacterium]